MTSTRNGFGELRKRQFKVGGEMGRGGGDELGREIETTLHTFLAAHVNHIRL